MLAVVVCASGTAGPGQSRIVHSLQGVFEQASGIISGLELTAITGQAAGVIFGEEVDHLFADDAAQVPRIAGAAGVHEGANLHYELLKLRNLKNADFARPERCGFEDAA